MVEAPPSLRRLLHWIAIVLTIAVVLYLIVGNWHFARKAHGSERLRWYLVPREAVVKGTHLREQHVAGRLGWIEESVAFVSRKEDVDHRFAARDLARGKPIEQDALLRAPDLTAPPRQVAVSVAVEASFSRLIEPGMHLGFVESGEAPRTLPRHEKGKRDPEGYLVLALLAPDGEEPKLSRLVVAASAADAELLAIGEWCPLVLSRRASLASEVGGSHP